MFIGAITFWTVMWKLLTFVGDLLEYYFKNRPPRARS